MLEITLDSSATYPITLLTAHLSTAYVSLSSTTVLPIARKPLASPCLSRPTADALERAKQLYFEANSSESSNLRWLQQPATSTWLDEITISLPTARAHWHTFTVRRKDRGVLLVADVLHAVELHLKIPLTAEEMRYCRTWPYNRYQSRVDIVKGRRLFSGLTYLGGSRFALNLS
ncbi:hypothetical protein DFH09DRAFT_1332482 [Mycena vulgaris]|nr:hypothetical protein DFH09DRAFT_1332482 [Mycena vulgaris]